MEGKDSYIRCNFLSLNVNGIREKSKREKICIWCKDKGVDIVFLQETYSTIEVEETWKLPWNGSSYFSHGTNHSKGVLILIDYKLDIQVLNVISDDNGRYVIMECIIQGMKLIIANVYLPVRGRELEKIDFLVNFEKLIRNINKENNAIIIGGDFNIILNKDLDYFGNSRHNVQSRFNILFEQFLDRFELLDIWRVRNGLKKQFTYRQINPFMQSRLDYWLVSKQIEQVVFKCDIIPSMAPDHSAIQLQFYDKLINSFKFQGSYWKLNNSLCQDIEYINCIKEEIIKLKEEFRIEIEDKRVLWDFLKMKIRNVSRKYSKEKAKQRK